MATKIGGKSEQGIWIETQEDRRVWISKQSIETVTVELDEDEDGGYKSEKFKAVTIRMQSGEEYEVEDEAVMGHFVDWVNRQA